MGAFIFRLERVHVLRHGGLDRRVRVSRHGRLHGYGPETLFFDRDGNLTRIQIHNVEQDVFTANRKTLVGLPYIFNLLIDPVTDEETHVFASGVASRVPLRGGDVFFTAGGNLAGFCAALAP